MLLLDYKGRRIPCIVLDAGRYGHILDSIRGRPTPTYTSLHVFDNDAGRVFVEAVLEFPDNGAASHGVGEEGMSETYQEHFIFDARHHVSFFEALAESSLLVLGFEHTPSSTDDDIMMIQMPRPEMAQSALDLIRKGLAGSGA